MSKKMKSPIIISPTVVIANNSLKHMYISRAIRKLDVLLSWLRHGFLALLPTEDLQHDIFTLQQIPKVTQCGSRVTTEHVVQHIKPSEMLCYFQAL